MLHPHEDPVVAILILAYRRGLVLRKEKDASKTADTEVVASNSPDDQDGIKVEETVIVEDPDS
jgi:hypothetical protein